MASVINEIKDNISKANVQPTIVFPEGHNEFVEQAALQLKDESNIKTLLVVPTDNDIKDNGLSYISMESYENKGKLIEKLLELRKAKGLTEEKAIEMLSHSNYFATMLVKEGVANGYVGGIEYTTADTLRPALQIIKTKPSSKIVSSVFIMEKAEERYLFADCAININPNAEQISEIAKQVIEFGNGTANMNEVRTGLLSYSTAGSAGGEDADKMKEAYEILKDVNLGNNKVYGSLQFDAAFIQGVMDKKAPELKWNKPANAFIFPNLSSGNIGYKIAQRMGGFNAIGPILMGLAAPVNDLSRGASVKDIVDVTYITALQAIRDLEAK